MSTQEDDLVLNPGDLQLDGGAKTGEPGPNDGVSYATPHNEDGTDTDGETPEQEAARKRAEEAERIRQELSLIHI